MTMKMVGDIHKQVAIDLAECEEQTSTNEYVVVEGSALNALPFTTVSYTISVTTNNINWKVFGANKTDFSDEIEVQGEATVNAGDNSSYSVTPAPYGYYRVKIKSAVAGTAGKATIAGVAKG